MFCSGFVKTCDELVNRYEMHQQQQNEMLRQQVLQNYQQYPPPTEHRHPQDYYHSQQWQYYPAPTQNVQYQ